MSWAQDLYADSIRDLPSSEQLKLASIILEELSRTAAANLDYGDANGDGTVDPLDSGHVLARFGCGVGTGDSACDAADQNVDGVVDPLDVGFVLSRFGECSD